MAPPTRPAPAAAGFHLVKVARPPRRLILNIMGAQKSGKNHFAFGAPGDIYFHSFDFGDEGVIEKFASPTKPIYKAEYRVDVPPGTGTQQTSDACTPVWNSFKTNYMIGLAKGKTSIIDTGTDAYELLRMSYFGKLGQVMPHHYAPVNAEMKEIIRQAYSSGKNLIVLSRVKDEWLNTVGKDGKEKGIKTGEKVMAGYSGLPFEVQVHMRAYRETDGFKMEVLDCRQNPDLNGMVLEGDMNNFQTLGTLVYPDSAEEEWL